ncbi:MAG: hypothetical protein ACREJ3_04910, partial [Polyangiaceae bacterium]
MSIAFKKNGRATRRRERERERERRLEGTCRGNGSLARVLVARALGAALLSFVLLAAGCTCGRGGPPPQAGRDFGDTHAAGVDAQAYLAIARAILEHRAPPAPAPPPSPGRRVLLALWASSPPGDEPAVATSNGATLADAVTRAATTLATPGRDVARARIELEVVTEVSGAVLSDDTPVPMPLVGIEGVLVTRDDGKTGVVLPDEIALRGMFHSGRQPVLDHDKIRGVLARRAGVSDTDLDAMRAYRFRVDAHVEAPAHDRALPVLRGMVEHPREATPELLLKGVREGADYLSRVMDEKGRYQYMVHPLTGAEDRSYGWLRHAGATYALLEAYEEFGTPLYLQKAEAALGYLHTRMRTAPEGTMLLDTYDEEQQKVGGAGLALIAFAKDASITGKLAEIETMRSLARLIIAQQYDDGRFRANADLEGAANRKREPVYYSGEATLGLMRLYAIDPKPMYLDAARKAADWIVHVRDAPLSLDEQEHDHWISYALNELYRVTRDEAYLNHAYKIARAIEKKQHRAEGAPAQDWIGTFYEG